MSLCTAKSQREERSFGGATPPTGATPKKQVDKGAPAALMASARRETRGTELRASYPAVNENPREPASPKDAWSHRIGKSAVVLTGCENPSASDATRKSWSRGNEAKGRPVGGRTKAKLDIPEGTPGARLVEPATINRFHLAAALFGAFAVWVLSMMLSTAIGDGRRIEHVERGDEIRGGEVWR